MKRERRRLQEQIRRIKRNEQKLAQAKSDTSSPTGASSSTKKYKKKENLKEIKVRVVRNHQSLVAYSYIRSKVKGTRISGQRHINQIQSVSEILKQNQSDEHMPYKRQT